MKMYVATTEYQDLIIGTEAYTPEECETRFIDWTKKHNIVEKDTWTSCCMAEVETSDTMFIQCTPLYLVQSSDSSRKYIKGFRTGEFIPAKNKNEKPVGDKS